MKGIKLIFSVVIILLLISAGACSSTSSTSTTLPPTYPPAISDVEAAVNDTSTGVSVNFFVRADELYDTSLIHIIYYFDVDPPTDPGKVAYTGAGTYIIQTALEESVTWKDVPSGKHKFSAQFVAKDTDKPFNPPVIATATIGVPLTTAMAPEIRNFSILPSLPNPDFVTATPQPVSQLVVQAASILRNFKMNDDAIGKQNVSGEGHLVYYLDVQPPAIPGQTALTAAGTYKDTTDAFHIWENVTPGKHVFSVQIVNNDNTPLDPPVFDQVVVTLPSRF
jgi:hypothetical protein